MLQPPYYFVRDKSSRVAHHWDYLRSRDDHALCGSIYRVAIAWHGEQRPRAVCRECQARVPEFDAQWWRDLAESRDSEIEHLNQLVHQLKSEVSETDDLKTRVASLVSENEALKDRVDNQRRALAGLNKARVPGQSAPSTKKKSQTSIPKPKAKKVQQSTKAKPGHRQPPPIRIVSGGLPGLGSRR